ncbi:unnamed protein product [Dovyalis caffra]|uniref:Disease resistance protein At4g27190-like leucine-rich repeats domain-containing protein n=1 Tax=Dovyalis caffra TaxID=77055 RepID=A0AAV1RZ27_9ROSI|nr:unnamed protein product [Dovyalis caffra]
MLFPKLGVIVLRNLPKLKQFCTGCLLECPLLKELTISICSGLETFISECGSLKEKRHSAIQPLFNEMRLEVLQIENCNLLEEILELEGPSVEGSNYASWVFQLRDLTLRGLPKLKHIWNNNPPGTLSFQDIRAVNLWRCDDLKNIFLFSIARNLPQLEKLGITNCGVEAIVAKSEDDETAPLFEFPQLTLLKLNSLGKLRNFYPGKHTLECPILKRLAVSGCRSVKLFGLEFLNFQEIQVEAQHDNPIQQSLFFVEKVIPNLEEFSLRGPYTNNASIMWHCQLPADFYSELKVLELHSFKRKSDRIPFGFLQRLRNLETLTVQSSSFKRLFLNEGIVEEEHKWKPAEFRNLILDSVYDMRHLWEQDHRLAPLLHNLKSLKVNNCHSLVNLAPSSASFQSLLTLDMKFCNGLSILITSSTAKNLAQLVNLTIGDCKMITEIVGKQGDEAEDEIVFSKMECLQLTNLKSLTSFCPGNDTFKFPLLTEVSGQRCPNMKIFCPGLLSTPKLQGVRGPRNKKWWQGNLNATIQQLYTEMIGFNGEWRLQLSDFPRLREMWHDRMPFNSFSGLYELIVDECAFVSNAIPSNLLKLMKNLDSITVKKCDSLEGVFDLIGLNAAEEHLKLLSRLRELRLIDLPRLMHLWNMDPQRILDLKNLRFLQIQNCTAILEIPSLERISIDNCPNMKAFVSSFLKEQEPHFNQKSCMKTRIVVQLKQLELSKLPKLVHLSKKDPVFSDFSKAGNSKSAGMWCSENFNVVRNIFPMYTDSGSVKLS